MYVCRAYLWRDALCAWVLSAAMAAQADWYSANEALAQQDYPRAFELFREIAELGHPGSQENLALMYVQGTGVKRDNVLGYAWAVIASENGGGQDMQNIIAQLQPLLNDARRIRVQEVTDRFGMTALRERLLPVTLDPTTPSSDPSTVPCRIYRPVNPDDYFPPEAARRGLSGNPIVEVIVLPDGTARDPRVPYSDPNDMFSEAARRVSMGSGYEPKRVDGVATSCVMRMRIKFTAHGTPKPTRDEEYEALRKAAEAGDPNSQVAYGLLRITRAMDMTSPDRPQEWFLKAAQAGVPLAQYFIGSELLQYGRDRRPEELPKALTWLTMAANAGQADAQITLAHHWMSREPDEATLARIHQWLENGAKTLHRDATLYLAALLAASPDAERRDPARALELLDELGPLTEFDPTCFEIRAAAHAAQGDFESAVREQNRALKQARRLKWDDTPLQQRMTAYAARQTWTGILFAD